MDNELFDLITGYRKSQIIYTAVKLNIFDSIYTNPKTLEEICLSTSFEPLSIYRLLNALILMNLIKKEHETFSLTEKALILSVNHPNNIKSRVLFHGEIAYQAWSYLSQSVNIDDSMSAFEKCFSKNFFDYLTDNDNARENFNNLMDISQNKYNSQLVSHLNLRSTDSLIIDVGGGIGHFSHAIAEVHKDKKIVVYDIHQTLIEAIKKNKFNPVVTYQAGDFFCQIPNGDVLILKRILHDWNDEQAARILQQCYKSVNKNGRLILVENILDESDCNSVLLDLNMKVLFNSKERCLEEYISLTKKSGFKHNITVEVNNELSIIDFYKELYE